jgi:hypothetical protein
VGIVICGYVVCEAREARRELRKANTSLICFTDEQRGFCGLMPTTGNPNKKIFGGTASTAPVSNGPGATRYGVDVTSPSATVPLLADTDTHIGSPKKDKVRPLYEPHRCYQAVVRYAPTNALK